MRTPRLLALLLAAALFIPQSGFAKHYKKGPFKYLSPLPGTEWISPQAKLTFRHKNRHDTGEWMAEVTVTGSSSGTRSGRWIAAADGETFIFDPSGEFVPGERVDVSMGRGRSPRFNYSFTVAPVVERDVTPPEMCSCLEGALPELPAVDRSGQPVTAPRMTAAGYELPTSFPDISVLVDDDPAPGSIFVAGMIFGDNPDPRYLMILDNNGEPEFFRPFESRTLWDFKLQPDGRLSFFHFENSWYYFMDDTYAIVDSVRCQNYSSTDAHGVQVLPNGNFLLMGQQRIPYDMSEVVEGGNPDAQLVNMIVQEIDGDNNVVFEWRSVDHFDPLDAIGYDLTGERVDYVHSNSVELDHDGGVIVSHRHLDEVTKLDRETADIIWHMGGKNNDFTLVGDDQWFTHQHSARRQADGTLTVFDNGNNSDPRESRVVEYVVDEENLIATLVWQYRHDPPLYGRAMGNAHRQPNGNTVIGWGTARPNMTEVRPDGSVAFELELPTGMRSYRAFRFEWDGVAARPDLWATMHDDVLALNFTRFGDREVKAYNVYRGPGPEPTELMTTTSANRVVVHGFDAGETLHFRVTALDPAGNESPFSNEIAVTPEFGDQLVAANLRVTPRTLNVGSQGRWIDARVDFPDGCGCGPSPSVDSIVLNETVGPDRVQLKHKRGEVDRIDLKFARADVADILDPGEAVAVTVTGEIGGRGFAATDFIRVIGPSDDDAAGDGKPRDAETGPVVLESILPNPFNPSTVVRFRTASPGQHVTVAVFDVTGRRVRTLVDGPVAAGQSTVTWDGTDHAGRPVSSGVYFCRLESAGVSQTRKMLLIK